ncbi:hypothetical protein GCM10012278_20000 [Nonomuraea glycinis]|uniref:Uncharacterized protein n=1 Tax=Nonomuraea glycinis TaxID=2047744 RepID=A0A918A5F9_9ACTN|nr:hypothetical protein GCM10012278_20000 [Nonomuraea glycinis]
MRGHCQVEGAAVTGVADIAGIGERREETIRRVVAITMTRIRDSNERRSRLVVREKGWFVRK